MTKLSTTKTASKKATTKTVNTKAKTVNTPSKKAVVKSTPIKKAVTVKAVVKSAPAKKAVVKTAPKSTKNNRSAATIEKAVAVINYAVESKITLAEASRAKGFGRNYVSDIKGRVDKNFAKNNINKTQYATFTSAYKRYEKTVK